MKFKILLSILFIGFFQTAIAQPEDNANSAPYFQVGTEGVSLEDFPLLSTKADVNITGPIADVTVTQTYHNGGNVPIEAIYVFPAATRSAVYAMTMKIGDRIIRADIQEKKEARKNYEIAKSEGKRASLLEQHRPNVFQMNVGNIMPGDFIEVELKYNEFIIPENKIYNFVYPTVVGPRFNDPNHQEPSAKFVSNPYGKEGADPSYNFDINIRLNAGMKLQESLSPTHQVDITYTGANTALIQLKPEDKMRGNKDFIFSYKLANNQISQGTFLYNHGDEQFFLTMLEPPARTIEEEIPAREYIFVMDVSGSMYGFPIDVSKNLLKKLIASLKPTDKFNVVQFAGGSKLMSSKSLLANTANLKKANTFIDQPQGGGGTSLLPALEKAMSLPRLQEGLSRSIVVVTDGYVHVERQAFELIANNLNKSNLFAFGIGSGVNRHLIEGMAHAGQGESFIVTEEKYAHREAERFRKYIQSPLLTNIEVSFDDFEAYDVSPASLPDLLADRPIYLFGKYKGSSDGGIIIKGYQGNKVYEENISISRAMLDDKNSPIRYLWAREKIRWLDDLNSLSQTEEDVAKVTELGLKYNLLTKHTSFVAIEETPVLANGDKTQTVKQVLPLPEGVSNYAVGFELKVDEVVDANKKKSSSQLFVHIQGSKEKVFQNALKSLMMNSIVFTKEEKSHLNGNTLLISYHAETQQWNVKDQHNRIQEDFIRQFISLLKELELHDHETFALTINLLWI